MDVDVSADSELVKSNLQANLLNAVKECQKKYGGRVELATELDPLVAQVCHRFEAVFNNGLKKNVQKHTTKKLVDVTFNEKPTFWHCVSNILSFHERDRYHSLHNVRTNWGRGRAFLRSALNERSLERYLNCLICNEELLAHYYEHSAFLRDQEKSYILPTAAAGLVPILFAVSIDRTDLNRRNNDAIDTTNEQIIVTTTMDVLKVNDVRKKIQRNIIEFGDINEDGGNYDEISASVSKTTDMSPSVELAVEASEVMNDDSSSQHDSEDNVSCSMSLRPVGDQVVGELIPVSTEVTESDDMLFPDYPSEDGISIESGDDMNFQKLYELTKEELKKQISSNLTLEARVQELNRENEVLKHQLRKYVSAVQMLKRDDADHTFEAQLYESKLVQVAEMHGELMELNSRLQMSIFVKEESIKRLQEELVRLRGPLPSDDFSLHKLVSLWIPSVFLNGRYSSPHHVYQVHFRIGSEEWNVYRRYAQFHSFHQKMKKEHSAVAGFHFPPKKTIGNKDANFVEERRKKLQLYLRQVINFLLTEDSHLAVNPTKALFTSRVQFFSEQYKDNSKSRSHSIFSNCLQHNQNNNDDNMSVQYTGL